jgi:hypothetical protein
VSGFELNGPVFELFVRETNWEIAVHIKVYNVFLVEKIYEVCPVSLFTPSDIHNIASSTAAVVLSHAKNAICLIGLEELPSHQTHAID